MCYIVYQLLLSTVWRLSAMSQIRVHVAVGNPYILYAQYVSIELNSNRIVTYKSVSMVFIIRVLLYRLYCIYKMYHSEIFQLERCNNTMTAYILNTGLGTIVIITRPPYSCLRMKLKWIFRWTQAVMRS